jgi:putative membrane protein
MNTEFPYQFLRKPLNWAVFMAVLVHVSGAIGIAFFDRNLFVSLTPVNLLLMFLLLLWNEGSLRIPFLLSLLIAFFTGLFTEMVGVHTGWLFGSYVYQPVMGPQLLEVPLLIGLNWFIVVYASFILVSSSFSSVTACRW